MAEQMEVRAIRRGTVIDHIRAGDGLKILNHLQLVDDRIRITVGLNLPSRQLGAKDIIKVENWVFSREEANELALLAPDATVNLIENYQVAEKFRMEMPRSLHGIFPCPNSNCISHSEPVETRFSVQAAEQSARLLCHYCEKLFEQQLFIR